MPHVDVTLPQDWAAVTIGAQAAEVAVPDSGVSVLAAAPSVEVVIPDAVVSVVCDDALASTFTTPTLTDWSVTALDLGPEGARFTSVACATAGSPCRIRFQLVNGSKVHTSRYSSPEQNTPHVYGCLVDIESSLDRGVTYDMYWSWTSGNESGSWALVSAASVYVPADGEGDYPAEA